MPFELDVEIVNFEGGVVQTWKIVKRHRSEMKEAVVVTVLLAKVETVEDCRVLI